MNYNLLVTGSSRSKAHFSPDILDLKKGFKTYNLGMDGHNFFMQYQRLKLYLKYNDLPKIIIQSLDDNTLAKRPDLYRYQQFLPYLDEPELLEACLTYNGLDKWDAIIPFKKYIGEKRIILYGSLEWMGIRHFPKDRYKGYQPKMNPWNGGKMEKIKKLLADSLDVDMLDAHVELDKTSLQLFENFIDQCKSDNVTLILVYTPSYIEGQNITQNRGEIFKYYYDMSEKHQIPFFDYSDHYLSMDKQYFSNSTHLNKKGSEIFTTDFANKLNLWIQSR